MVLLEDERTELGYGLECGEKGEQLAGWEDGGVRGGKQGLESKERNLRLN